MNNKRGKPQPTRTQPSRTQPSRTQPSRTEPSRTQPSPQDKSLYASRRSATSSSRTQPSRTPPVLRRPADKNHRPLGHDPRTDGSRSDERSAPQPTTKVWHRNRAPLHQSERRPKSEGELHYAIASSQSGPGGYKKFGDIPAHKLGKALRGRLYQVANALPDSEHGNLVSRIKHAATTVTAALAQGFGEGTFRAIINRALESRGALMAVQDHIEQLGELGFVEAEEIGKLKEQVDAVIASLNEYLGSVVKEQQRLRSS